MSIEDLFEKNSEEILETTEEYRESMALYCNLREELENELALTEEQREKLDRAFDLVFETEYILHKQSFIKGFKMARDLFIS